MSLFQLFIHAAVPNSDAVMVVVFLKLGDAIMKTIVEMVRTNLNAVSTKIIISSSSEYSNIGTGEDKLNIATSHPGVTAEDL